MTCGLPCTLSVTFSVACLPPVVFGVKVTMIEQLDPGPSVAGDRGHVVVCAKSPASAPLIVGFLTVIGVPLGLPTVMVWGLLFTPTLSVPKPSALGKIPTTGRFSKRETVPDSLFATAKSPPPSPLRSASTRPIGDRPTG